MSPILREVPVNDVGRRIGEGHPHARYTDGEVEMVRLLRDAGKSYNEICRIAEMPRTTVRDICSGRRRGQPIARWRKVAVRGLDLDGGGDERT